MYVSVLIQFSPVDGITEVRGDNISSNNQHRLLTRQHKTLCLSCITVSSS